MSDYGGSGGLSIGQVSFRQWDVRTFKTLTEAVEFMALYEIKNLDQLAHYGDIYYVYLPTYPFGRHKTIDITKSQQ